MNAHTKTSRSWRNAQVAGMALLLAAGACDSTPEGGPMFPDIPSGRVEVFSNVQPSFAGIGDQVLVTIDFESTLADDAQQRAHVSWDAATFEYMHPLPPSSSRYLSQDLARGTMNVDVDLPAGHPKSRIILVFRAMANTSTSGINVNSHDAPPLP